MPRPDEPTYDALASWLESELDRAAAAAPNPGRPVLRRLNRSEYANAIRDLLDLEVETASLLPADDSAFGFDNISDLLGVSPALLDRYLVAADRISAMAVGAPVGPGSRTYRIRQDRAQDQHIDRLPLGTVGGLAVDHEFPVDGEYQFSLELYRTNLEAIRGLEHPHQIEVTVDGRRVFLGTVGGDAEREGAGAGSITDRSDAIDARLRARVPVTAGPHLVGATFIRKIGEGTQRLRPFLRSSAGTYDSTGRPHIETLTIAGPFTQAGPGDTPSRRRIFSCRAVKPSVANDEACAKKILSTLAHRAYQKAGHRGRDDGPARLLQERRGETQLRGRHPDGPAPHPREPDVHLPRRRGSREADAPGATYRLSDLELASRLSFFLWSSIPDDELLELAERDRLGTPAVLEQQVRRMLADPRAEALVENFAGQWLHIRNLQNIVPNHDEFPDFDDKLREALPSGDGAVLRKRDARGSQRPRPADGRLHVRQRAAGQALRHS